jgi:hypothetical protein
MKLNDIQRRPTTIDGIHESRFRSYAVLEYVLKMVERGDSKETIIEISSFLKGYNLNVETVNTKDSQTTL